MAMSEGVLTCQSAAIIPAPSFPDSDNFRIIIIGQIQYMVCYVGVS